MQADQTAAGTSDLLGQVKDRAQALGLTWQLNKATVFDGRDPTAVSLVMDGDTATIAVVSMVGPLPQDARVWVMSVPPGGNYITGIVSGGPAFYSARTILKSVTASITFSNIPTGLRRLRISHRCRADNAVQAQTVLMQVNGDVAANYFYEYVQANNAAVAGVPGSAVGGGVVGICTGASAGANVFGSGQAEIQGWDRLASNVNLNWTFVSQGLGNGVGNFFSQSGGGLYNGAGPYTSLVFLPAAGNFIAGTDIQLEGWPS